MSTSELLLPENPGGIGRKIVLVIGVLAVALSVVTVWSVTRPTGDLYVGLAAGRDIVAGKLGTLDDWAFTTTGRVWVNQNWGTNMLYWISNRLGGEAGLLVLKLMIIMTGTGFLVLACRRREADWPVALIVTAGIIAAGRSFIDLRPNLTTLMFTPVMLHLLYRTAGRPRRIWLTMFVFGVIWANLHGGFTMGLVAMFFWAGCVVVLPMLGEEILASWIPGAAIAGAGGVCMYYATGSTTVGVVGLAVTLAIWWMVRRNLRLSAPAQGKAASGPKVVVTASAGETLTQRAGKVLRQRWPYVAAAFGAVVLAGVVSPFGVHNLFRDFSQLKMPFWELFNLTHPTVVMAGENRDLWQGVIEWNSIFTASPQTFGTSWEFFGIVGLFFVLVGAQTIHKCVRRLPLDVEDIVLLAVIVGVSVAAFAQAMPIHEAFGKMLEKWEFDGNMPPDVIAGVRLQSYGWLAVLMVYPLLGLLAVAAGAMAIWKWVETRQVVFWSAERLGIVVFDVCLAAGGIKMAFDARRFMPLSLMLLAPLLARRMQWALGELGATAGRLVRADQPGETKPQPDAHEPVRTPAAGVAWYVPAMLTGLAVIGIVSVQALANYSRYDQASPFTRYRSVLKNMIVYNRFSPNARDFILDNDLSGKCFNEWRWEGYLRWYCPKLKMFIGGRAQQAYDAETYKKQRSLMRGDMSPAMLGDMGVLWIIVPLNTNTYSIMIEKAMNGPDAQWAPIFCDGENIILANAKLPIGKEMIAKCLAAKLVYRDKAFAYLSQGMCLRSGIVNRPAEAFEDFRKAQQAEPIYMAYMAMGELFNTVKPDLKAEAAYLEGQNLALAKMDYHHLNGFEILRCRFWVLNTLLRLYEYTKQPEPYRQARDQLVELDKLMGRLVREWN